MKYETTIATEIARIVEALESKLEEQEFTKNLCETKTLCRCFLLSLFQLIQGVYAALQVRSLLTYEITCRSIIEHIIDLYLIALRSDIVTNRRFANYHKILLYRGAKDVEFYVEEIPRIKREYRDYVLNEFPDVIDKHTHLAEGIAVPNWREIDRKIENKYRNHWSGMTFYDRVIAVVVALYGRRKLRVLIDDWQSYHGQAIRSAGDQWQRMSFKEKCLEVLRQVSSQGQHSHKPTLDDIEPFTMQAMSAYQKFSNYIHPSSYSTVPHHNPATGAFELSYNYSDNLLQDAEHFLFLLLDASVQGYSICLTAQEENQWIEYFHGLVNSAPNLANWFWNDKNTNATRPRN